MTLAYAAAEPDAGRRCAPSCAQSETVHESHARTRRRRSDTVAARACAEPESACSARRDAPADDGHARSHHHGAVDLRHRSAAARARHRWQRLVFPRSRGNLALAPIQSPGRRREALGCREASRPIVHLRQAVLVVQHVRVGRLFGDAAPHVYGRRSASCPMSTRILRSFATNCNASWDSSRSSNSGDPRPTSSPHAGSAAARCAYSSVSSRR